MTHITEQLRSLDDRLASALQWLEDRKIARLQPAEYEELTKIYWLLRDMRLGISATADRWRENATILRAKGDTVGANTQEFCANELVHLAALGADEEKRT